MKKIEQYWIIQRNDGKFYFECADSFYNEFISLNENKSITFYKSKHKAQEIIKWYFLQNCKPVKVEVRVIGE